MRFYKFAALMLVSVMLFPLLSFSNVKPGSVLITKYFEGTDYELEVYTIKGRRDGKTMLILGGIQGDEPGGYLSADLYADLRLEKGNLIVIPRGSLKSVILFNRGVDGDMNRLFSDSSKDTIDQKVVFVIMDYIKKSDIFLNLHDGWGYHSPVYVDKQRNPNRFGQSIIVDSEAFTCSDNTTIELGKMAKDVLEKVNEKIDDEKHHLAYFNTRTGEKDTKFKDMQKTATWYALNHKCIPAFGIESSKNLSSLEMKVLYHNYAVNEFMKIMGIIPEIPPVYITPAEFYSANAYINGVKLQLHNGDKIDLKAGDRLKITDIYSNYTRGLSCDVQGHGNYNDINKEFRIYESTNVTFRKDNKVIARAYFNIDKGLERKSITLKLSLNGEQKNYTDGSYLDVRNGDVLIIDNAYSDNINLDFPINLKGWVSKEVSYNNGDDRGYTNVIDSTTFIKKFSVKGLGKVYPIIVNDGKKDIMKIMLRIKNEEIN